jgi:hypothetical protein
MAMVAHQLRGLVWVNGACGYGRNADLTSTLQMEVIPLSCQQDICTMPADAFAHVIPLVR